MKRVNPIVFAIYPLILFVFTSPIAAQVRPPDCGCDQALPAVIATVDDRRLSAADLDSETEAKIKAFKQEVIEARSRELDLQINAVLLAAEATRRKVSAAKLIKLEVADKTPEPTEAEALAFYQQNKAGMDGEFTDVKRDIVEYLREQKQNDLATKLAQRLRAAAQVRIMVQQITPPATAAERTRVFATVNGTKITSADVEDNLKPLIANVQEQVYALRKNALDLKINDLLLEAEAKKRGTTVPALLDLEVDRKVTPVTEVQAQDFYDKNRSRIKGEFATVKQEIINYLYDQAKRDAEARLASQLRAHAKVQIFLKEPEPTVFAIDIHDQPERGNPAARVTLVEFSDFQCPACGQVYLTLEELMKEFGDRVKFVMKDYPLSQHENAFKAAEAAEAARQQGKYWEYIDVLFRHQTKLDLENLKQYARDLGLEQVKFNSAVDNGRYYEQIQHDLLDGEKLGVAATPTIFINGRRISDISYSGIKASLEKALKIQ
jgi:protein-disulfide isomerase